MRLATRGLLPCEHNLSLWQHADNSGWGASVETPYAAFQAEAHGETLHAALEALNQTLERREAAVRCMEWLDALEREIASKEKYAHEVEINVGKTSSIHEADYARGVVDGLRVARSYGLAMTSASNSQAER